jgi:hypothetical protein
MSGHQRRVLDLSANTYVPPQQRPVVQQAPVVLQVRQQPYVQNVLMQGISNPTYTQTGMGPFENVRSMQDNTARAQQMVMSQQQLASVVQSTPIQPMQQPAPIVQRREGSHQSSKPKGDEVIVNGCDVTGCTTIAEAYEKNKGKIKFVLP